MLEAAMSYATWAARPSGSRSSLFGHLLAPVICIVPLTPAVAQGLSPLPNLLITERGLVERDTGATVLDIRHLEASLPQASKYFMIRHVSPANNQKCGNASVGDFNIELSRDGQIYACATLKSAAGIEHLAFVGPLEDKSGARPGTSLTNVRGLNPAMDCLYPEGTIVCPSPYSSVVTYEAEGCAQALDYDKFELLGGAVDVCYIALIYPFAIHSADGENDSGKCCVVVPSDKNPSETVEAIYLAHQAATEGAPRIGPVFSKRVQAIIDADKAAFQAGGDFAIDYSFFFDGNDFRLQDIEVSEVQDTNEPQVRATFKNKGERQDFWFTMRREDGRWVIDDVMHAEGGKRLSLVPPKSGVPAPAFRGRPAP